MLAPRWKEDLRRRCLERASRSRRELVSAARAGSNNDQISVAENNERMTQAVCTQVLGELRVAGGAFAENKLSDLARAIEESLQREMQADIAALAASSSVPCPACSAGDVSLVEGWLVCSRYVAADSSSQPAGPGCEVTPRVLK